MKKIVLMGLLALAALSSFGGAKAQKVKVACIGDSITYGMCLPNRETECYPVQLQQLLDERFPGVYEVRNFGNSGRGIYLDSMRGNEKRGYRWMVEHKAALEWRPDIVICNLGINDNGEYLKEYSGGRRRGQFTEDYCALLGDYKKLNPDTKFFIWTKLAPLAKGQRFRESPEPFLMQTDLEEVARRMGATGIDMQAPLMEQAEKILAKDKIHPDAEGARLIAEATFKVLTSPAPAKLSVPADVAQDNCETWLCVGQSNMQKGWGEFNATREEKTRVQGELARLRKCDIRLWDVNGGTWTKLTPQNALAKSALGVSFAIRRAETTGKTILILYVAAGGAPTESFLGEDTMCAVGKDGKAVYPQLLKIAVNRHRLDENADFPCKWVAREYPRRRGNREEAYWWPVSKLYDAGLRPIKASGIKVDGVLWYQGESNATTCVSPDEPTDADYQRETLRAVMGEFRMLAPEAKILVMGLPKMNRPWERYRESQRTVCAETGAVYIDTFAAGLGDMNDVHPRDKRPFADLAAEAAAK